MLFVKIAQEGGLKEGEKPKTLTINHKKQELNEVYCKNKIYSELKHTK